MAAIRIVVAQLTEAPTNWHQGVLGGVVQARAKGERAQQQCGGRCECVRLVARSGGCLQKIDEVTSHAERASTVYM